MGKRIQFEVDGEQHELVMKPFRKSMMKKLKNLDDADDSDDWGVESFVESIDGADPESSDVSIEAMWIAIDFLGQSASRSTVSRPVRQTTRKRKRKRRK